MEAMRAARHAAPGVGSPPTRLLGHFPEGDIRRIEASGQPTKTLTLRAPASGIVVEKKRRPQ